MCSSPTTLLQNAASHGDGTSSETHHPPPPPPSSSPDKDPKLRNHLPAPRFPTSHTGLAQHCCCKMAGTCMEKSWHYEQLFCSKPGWYPLPCPPGGILLASPTMGCSRDLPGEKEAPVVSFPSLPFKTGGLFWRSV